LPKNLPQKKKTNWTDRDKGGYFMWYATETVFIDGKLFDTHCCFKDGDTTGVAGHCFSNETEPGNSCKTECNGRIEIHTDWFESERLAHDFCDGKITYVHTYETHYNASLKTNFNRFMGREIVMVGGDILPYRGIAQIYEPGQQPNTGNKMDKETEDKSQDDDMDYLRD
jgi:hypothetical protein